MSKQHQDILIEIGCEELPPKALIRLAAALTKHIGNDLDQQHFAHGELETYATPRRLAVIVKDVAPRQPDRAVERKGPPLTRAFDDAGKPTAACLGFAQSCGVNVDALTKVDTPKGTWLVHREQVTGQTIQTVLPDILNHAITQLPIPKAMRWGAHTTEFVRPVHWVVLMYGKTVVEATILGIKTGNQTYGHRFHHPGPLTIKQPSDYATLLEKRGYVIADPNLRRLRIQQQIADINAQLSEGCVLVDDDLLAEVTAIVEWPVALHVQFDKRFLHVPIEVLICAMQSHQKCFPVVSKTDPNQLLPDFITISNIDSRDKHAVITGNQRVMRARLDDAAFFFTTDKQHSLASHLPALEHVIYQQKLGNLRDRVQRISHIAKQLAIGLQCDPILAERAGLLCKCDLKTNMVGEFPELQGIMGYYYALHDEEPRAVATAIKQHYQPRFANDVIPASEIGCIVAIADKIDVLIGHFGIGQMPTGDKDPFGLRRSALGVLRIMLEKQFDIGLIALLECALEQYHTPLTNQQVIHDIMQFCYERLRAWYIEQGGKADIFAAVMVRQSDNIVDIWQRLHAVAQFQQLPQAAALAAANKRVTNLLKKSAMTEQAMSIQANLLIEPAEQQLAQQLNEKQIQVAPLLKQKAYTDALSLLATLQQPVDAFFDNVLVMADDPAQQQNRLALLAQLRNMFLEVADISLLQVS